MKQSTLALRLPKHLRHLLHPTTTLWQVELALRLLRRSLVHGIGFFIPAVPEITRDRLFRTIEQWKLLPREYLSAAKRHGDLPYTADGVAFELLQDYTARETWQIRPEIHQRYAGAAQGKYPVVWMLDSFEDNGRRVPVAILSGMRHQSLTGMTVDSILRAVPEKLPSVAYYQNLCALLDDIIATFEPNAWAKTVTTQLAVQTAKHWRSTVQPDLSKAALRNLRHVSRQMNAGAVSNYNW